MSGWSVTMTLDGDTHTFDPDGPSVAVERAEWTVVPPAAGTSPVIWAAFGRALSAAGVS